MGGSIISKAGEYHRSSKGRKVKVRQFLGSTTKAMSDYIIKPIVKKAHDIVIIHTGTNDLVNNRPRTVLDRC